MNVLVVNSGSSTLKFQIIATDLERISQDKDDRICLGEVEGIGGAAIIRITYRDQATQTLTQPLRDTVAALEHIVRYIASDSSGIAEVKSTTDINAVGHRVVHGGEMFKNSALVDDQVLKGIEDCIDLAPLHNPNNVKGIQAARELFGKDVPRSRYLTLRFINRFQSRRTYMPFRIIFIDGTAFAATASMAPLIAMWLSVIVRCVD